MFCIDSRPFDVCVDSVTDGERRSVLITWFEVCWWNASPQPKEKGKVQPDKICWYQSPTQGTELERVGINQKEDSLVDSGKSQWQSAGADVVNLLWIIFSLFSQLLGWGREVGMMFVLQSVYDEIATNRINRIELTPLGAEKICLPKHSFPWQWLRTTMRVEWRFIDLANGMKSSTPNSSCQ